MTVLCPSALLILPQFLREQRGSSRTRKGRRQGRDRMNNRIGGHGGRWWRGINRTVAAFQKDAVTS